MRRKRRVVSNDGLIVTELQDLTGLTDQQWRALGPSPGGLEWYLHDAERIWRPHAAPRGTLAEEGSLALYADQILTLIMYIRVVRQRGQLDDVGRATLQLGRLHERAFWRHNLGDDMRLGVKIRRKNREAARKPRTRDRQDVAGSNARIVKEARRLRQQHPYSGREYSTRWLAKEITRLRVVPYSFSTIRRRLTALSIS
jgi:hypothetical protein